MQGNDTTIFNFGEQAEDLCDALGGRYEPEDSDDKAEKAKSHLTVDEAMRMLELRFQVELARMLEVKAEAVTQWKTRGYIPERKAKKIRALYRGMLVRAAA